MKTWQRFDPNRWCKTWAPDVIRGPFSESSADMFQRVLDWLFDRGLGLDELAKRLDVRQEQLRGRQSLRRMIDHRD